MKKKLLTFFTMGGWILLFVLGFLLLGLSIVAELFAVLFISIFMLLLSIIGSWISYIYCIIHAAKNVNKSDKGVVSLILILIFGLFYLPIYYTNYVLKDKKWLGILTCVITSLLFIIFYVAALILSIMGV